MNQPSQQKIAIELNENYCGNCSICFSLCPFEAIKRDPKTGKAILDVEKCQVCGICYSTCPAGSIDTIYYNTDSLINYLERAKREHRTNTLVIMCKGSVPDFGIAEELFGISKFIPLSIPCVGRISPEFLLEAIAKVGVEKIHVLACEEGFCRFEKGSKITRRKIMAVNLLLRQFGYEGVIDFKLHGLKVKVDRYKCIRCGNCAFYCPYDAVKLEAPEAASFDLDLCKGCGLCIGMCPSMALELEKWERSRISALISKLFEKERPRILVFRCQWSVFPPLDAELFPNVRIIDLPCAARADPLLILEALHDGADGVLVVACPEEDCKLENGSKEAQRLVMELKKRLSQIGIGDRLHFCSVAPRNPEIFVGELQKFEEKIQVKG